LGKVLNVRISHERLLRTFKANSRRRPFRYQEHSELRVSVVSTSF
jgi:hypothetical protein